MLPGGGVKNPKILQKSFKYGADNEYENCLCINTVLEMVYLLFPALCQTLDDKPALSPHPIISPLALQEFLRFH